MHQSLFRFNKKRNNYKKNLVDESEIMDGEYINVFLPTTPNPTSGFYLIVPTEEVKKTELSPEQAFKLIISAGIVQS